MSHASLETGLPGLEAMWLEMQDASPVLRPSAFWQGWNKEHMRLLADDGYTSFKRTINRSYFNWTLRTPLDTQFRVVLADALRRRPGSAALHAELEPAAGAPFPTRAWQRRMHAVFVALLWEYVHARDRYELLDRLDEPLAGGPITVRHRGRMVSQDLCNSVHEVTSMLEGRPGPGRPRLIIELGGGYGRVAWTMLKAFPDVRYVLVDIPPALAVAQRYLTEQYPELTTFRFRIFDDLQAAHEELARAQIAFLTPTQLDALPPLGADLFVNISSLHEMRPEQIAHFLRAVDRHCTGNFYTKQWKRSVNPADGCVITREDYPIPDHWQRIFSRDHPIQTRFFEALYRLGPQTGHRG